MRFTIPPLPAPDVELLYVRLPPESLVLLNGLLEAYDDLAVIRTLEPARGIAVIMATPGESAMVRRVIASETAALGVEYLEPEPADRHRWEEIIHGLA